MLYDPKWEIKQKPQEAWREQLHRAAEIIQSRRLYKGGFEGDDGSVCTLRALEYAGEAMGFGPHAGESRTQLMRYLGIDSVINWTDESSRTQAEVIAALEGAARSRT